MNRLPFFKGLFYALCISSVVWGGAIYSASVFFSDDGSMDNPTVNLANPSIASTTNPVTTINLSCP